MKYIKTFFRILLIGTFFSFYIISFMINFANVNEYIKPIEVFGLKKEYRINKNLYLSTFPLKEDLIEYKQKYNVERIIAVLNYKMLISKELLKKEEEYCKELGIELIYVPISYFNPNLMDISLIKVLLKESSKTTLIHAYYYDKRMVYLQQALSVRSD